MMLNDNAISGSIPPAATLHSCQAQNSTQASQASSTGEEKFQICICRRAPRPPQYVTFPLNDLSVASLRLSTSTGRLGLRRLLQYLTFPLFHFGQREKTAPRVLVEFLPSCYVRHTHTMAAAVCHSGGLNCMQEYLSIKHCLTCGRSVPSKHIAQTSMRRQEGNV